MVPRTVESEHRVMKHDQREPQRDPTKVPSEVPRLLERTSSGLLRSAISSAFRRLSNCLRSLDFSSPNPGFKIGTDMPVPLSGTGRPPKCWPRGSASHGPVEDECGARLAGTGGWSPLRDPKSKSRGARRLHCDVNSSARAVCTRRVSPTLARTGELAMLFTGVPPGRMRQCAYRPPKRGQDASFVGDGSGFVHGRQCSERCVRQNALPTSGSKWVPAPVVRCSIAAAGVYASGRYARGCVNAS